MNVPRALLKAKTATALPIVSASKYHTASKEKRTWEGIVFDSLREMTIFQQYSLLLRSGQLTSLERQVRFPLVVNGITVCTYVADIRLTWADGRTELAEVKGYWTETARLKFKLFRALYPEIKIEVVK